MSFDFAFVKNNITDNATALNINKNVADELIRFEPKLHSLNETNSKYHYKNLQIEDLDNDFPESHFQLFGEINDLNFLFNFWKDKIYIELGRVDNVDELFQQIESFSIELIKHGYLIEHPIEDKVLDLKQGLEVNKFEYSKWCSLVDKVEDIVKNKK